MLQLKATQGIRSYLKRKHGTKGALGNIDNHKMSSFISLQNWKKRTQGVLLGDHMTISEVIMKCCNLINASDTKHSWGGSFELFWKRTEL